MSGQRIGYVRVSSVDQNPDRQLEDVQLDRVFIDKVSGKSKDRPALSECLKFIRSGDTLIIHSMDRLARNLDDLKSMVNTLTADGIKIEFIKEALIFTGDDSPISKLLLNMMGAFAEFERSLILERQREGIELAKKRGVYKGRKRSLNSEQISKIKELDETGVAKSKIAREFNVSRQTIYSVLE
jgi:DNA invertase Pin-like site-specific DNA recombinase